MRHKMHEVAVKRMQLWKHARQQEHPIIGVIDGHRIEGGRPMVAIDRLVLIENKEAYLNDLI